MYIRIKMYQFLKTFVMIESQNHGLIAELQKNHWKLILRIKLFVSSIYFDCNIKTCYIMY